MTPSFDQIRELAGGLPAEQRILLANSLWESAAWGDKDATDAEVTAAWDAEIGRRVGEIQSGTAKTCSLDDLKADLDSIVQR